MLEASTIYRTGSVLRAVGVRFVFFYPDIEAARGQGLCLTMLLSYHLKVNRRMCIDTFRAQMSVEICLLAS